LPAESARTVLPADLSARLALGAVTLLVRLALAALRARRVELPGLFTLSLLAIGTAVEMVTADARLPVAREATSPLSSACSLYRVAASQVLR